MAETALFLCSVAGRRIALPAAAVAEVLPLLPLWRPPAMPSPLAGFVNVRGATLPVLATAVVLGLAERLEEVDGYAHIVRPRGASARSPYLLVDRVEARVAPGQDAVRPVAERDSLNGTVMAEVVLEDGAAHLLALDRLLDAAERERLASLTAAAEARAAQWAAREEA